MEKGDPRAIYPRSQFFKERKLRLGWGGLKIATEAAYQYVAKEGAYP